MRIGLTSIFVDDQDQAERFYTQVLPGRALADRGVARGARRGGAGAAPDRRAGAGVPAASRELGRSVLSLRNDDCRRDAERLKAKGVVFVKEPGRMAYGGMDAVFDDTCGNLINLHQD